MTDFVARDESTDIDLDIVNIKTIYKVKDKFKLTQKTTNGKKIPFEIIDKSLYKESANCACFLTNEKRICSWISSLAKVLWKKGVLLKM